MMGPVIGFALKDLEDLWIPFSYGFCVGPIMALVFAFSLQNINMETSFFHDKFRNNTICIDF